MMTDECVDMLVMKLTQMRLDVKRRHCLFYKHSTMLAAKINYEVGNMPALTNISIAVRCGALRSAA